MGFIKKRCNFIKKCNGFLPPSPIQSNAPQEKLFIDRESKILWEERVREELNPGYFQIYEMKIQGKRNKEIAQETGKSEKYVGSAVQRIKKILDEPFKKHWQ